MTRRTLVPAAVSALACLAAVPAVANAATPKSTGWSATATQAVPTGDGVTSLGALSGSTPLTVTLVLPLRNASAIPGAVAAGTTLTRSQFQSTYAPSGAAVVQVERYLRSQGLSPTAVSGNQTLITATGTAAQVESAFDTTLASVMASSVRSGSVTGYANLTGASVPSSLHGLVSAVLGLNDVYEMQPDAIAHVAATNPPSSCTVPGVGYPCTYNPKGFQKAYDATGTTTGAATREAIFAEGDLTGVVSDLRTEETANGMPQVPVKIIATGIPSSDTSGADEWDLDTQYSTGMAQKVKSLDIYDATTLTDSDLARSFADFASRDAEKAGSASFGECEAQASIDGSMLADDEQFAEAALQGQTVFASAGDTGGFCTVAPTNGVPAGVPDVEYPASSPYVVGVGGTTLVTNADGSYDTEAAWTAGGGGISYFESAPGWQASDGVIGTIGSKANLRTLPDVSMDADPNSGANVYVGGTPEGVGGTSLASPLSLGVWDRIEAAHGQSLGFASPLLYGQLSGSPIPTPSAAFHDVSTGDTGPYPATPGYDLATGIGSFDVAQAIALIH